MAGVGVEVYFIAQVAEVKVVGLADFFGDVGAGGGVVGTGGAVGADVAPRAGARTRGGEL